jgi:hypothetical protein
MPGGVGASAPKTIALRARWEVGWWGPVVSRWKCGCGVNWASAHGKFWWAEMIVSLCIIYSPFLLISFNPPPHYQYYIFIHFITIVLNAQTKLQQDALSFILVSLV